MSFGLRVCKLMSSQHGTLSVPSGLERIPCRAKATCRALCRSWPWINPPNNIQTLSESQKGKEEQHYLFDKIVVEIYLNGEPWMQPAEPIWHQFFLMVKLCKRFVLVSEEVGRMRVNVTNPVAPTPPKATVKIGRRLRRGGHYRMRSAGHSLSSALVSSQPIIW